jgi:hypothetical protein
MPDNNPKKDQNRPQQNPFEKKDDRGHEMPKKGVHKLPNQEKRDDTGRSDQDDDAVRR